MTFHDIPRPLSVTHYLNGPLLNLPSPILFHKPISMIFKLKKYYNNLEIHDNLIQLEAIDLFNQKKTFEIQKKSLTKIWVRNCCLTYNPFLIEFFNCPSLIFITCNYFFKLAPKFKYETKH